MNHLDSIFVHAEAQYPNESCGVIILEKGVTVWIPCANHAEDPAEEFQFNSVEYIQCVMRAEKMIAIVHSHCDSDSNPSQHDIKACNFLNIPYLIVSWPDKGMTLVTPGEFSV